MAVQKVIVLLHPSYNHGKAEITASITARCNDNTLRTIDMITLEDQYDSESLHQMIQIISNQRKPVTLVTKSNIFTSNTYFITWAIIKALSSAGLIDELQIYRKNYHNQCKDYEVKLYLLKKKVVDFLAISLEHFQRAVRRIYVQSGRVISKIKSLGRSK